MVLSFLNTFSITEVPKKVFFVVGLYAYYLTFVVIPIHRLNSVFFHRLLFQSLAGWFFRGCLPGHPLKNQKSHPSMPQGHGRRDVLFSLRWTERIGSCRTNAMVVPTGWFERLSYFNY
jgi:hypothetical protein